MPIVGVSMRFVDCIQLQFVELAARWKVMTLLVQWARSFSTDNAPLMDVPQSGKSDYLQTILFKWLWSIDPLEFLFSLLSGIWCVHQLCRWHIVVWPCEAWTCTPFYAPWWRFMVIWRMSLLCGQYYLQTMNLSRQISNNSPLCNRNVHKRASFCFELVHCGR